VSAGGIDRYPENHVFLDPMTPRSNFHLHRQHTAQSSYQHPGHQESRTEDLLKYKVQKRGASWTSGSRRSSISGHVRLDETSRLDISIARSPWRPCSGHHLSGRPSRSLLDRLIPKLEGRSLSWTKMIQFVLSPTRMSGSDEQVESVMAKLGIERRVQYGAEKMLDVRLSSDVMWQADQDIGH
jgi:hypothetical protein